MFGDALAQLETPVLACSEGFPSDTSLITAELVDKRDITPLALLKHAHGATRRQAVPSVGYNILQCEPEPDS